MPREPGTVRLTINLELRHGQRLFGPWEKGTGIALEKVDEPIYWLRAPGGELLHVFEGARGRCFVEGLKRGLPGRARDGRIGRAEPA